MPQIIEIPGQGRVEFPDGMSDAEITSAIQKNYPNLNSASSPQTRTLGDQAKRAAGLALRGGGPIGAGAIAGATMGSVIPGVGTALGAGAGATAAGLTQLVDRLAGTHYVDTAMDKMGIPRPETPIERITTNAIGAMSGAGGQLGLLNNLKPVSQVGEGLRKVMIQQPAKQILGAATGASAATGAGELGAGPVGQTIAGLAGGMAPFVPGMIRGTPSPETLRTAETAKEGMGKGYVVPPDQTNPTAINRVLTGSVSGKAPTERAASFKNQETTNNLVKQDLGIPAERAVTVGELRNIRSQAGAVYKDIKAHGQYGADEQFVNDINSISQAQQTLAKEAPSLANKDVLNTIQDLKKESWSGNTLIEINKALREKATAAYKAGETSVGGFYRGTADALEDLIGRNLSASGKPDLVNKWNQARQQIAKTYTAEAALNDSTGNFSARVLGSQFDKGGPISGNMKSIGRFANAFPGAVQEGEQVARFPGLSVTDALTGATAAAGGAAYANSPYGMLAGLIPLARPLTRSVILSPAYQQLMAQPAAAGISRPDAIGLGMLSGSRSK